ncbi:DarT ssDNA thymidine ADP-ribosyltransferase family protein [Anoxybacillus ayderensis]|uniref:DarT ssDNA thymidine ADP-ribosyltransferase family protein n=1 Tax=Anoxybacillus ayderensis TaxID=265546 RepID=UPI000A272538|nr:DarT ssDNA thymidine ADP-ribosyltransferase family protein [Anoxybacillus ayderensis]OSX53221.1 hypothetical protein B7H16_12740 [Anoxybacillus ayderensis]
MYDTIKNFILNRGIENVYHFTREENLESILNMGILSKKDLKDRRIKYTHNDQLRLDGFENAISCSISFPNYKMFFKYREQNPNVNWSVIELSSEVLHNKECHFCRSNAASSTVKKVPTNFKRGIVGLKDMFAEKEGHFTRKQMDLPDHYPTDPQAEVLVFGVIDTSYFKRIIFNDEITANKFKGKYGAKFQFVVDKSFFCPRKDYDFWR